MGKSDNTDKLIKPENLTLRSLLPMESTGKTIGKPEDKEEKETFNCGKLKINKDLLRFKAFYFLFFAGFGSTFPYLGVYFKQIGLNASYAGILAGIRPLIQFASGPFWAFLADRYKARKAILLFSIFAWLVMTLLLALPRPKREFCKRVNVTYYPAQNLKGKTTEDGSKKSMIPNLEIFSHLSFDSNRRIRSINNNDRITDALHYASKSNESVENLYMNRISVKRFLNESLLLNKSKISDHAIYVIQRDQNEIREIFIILLILIVTGEFMEAPSFIMADTALLEHLGEKRKHYGKTRLFGSLGYGVASFTIGAVIDKFHFKFCGKEFTNYIIIFYFFAAFMVIAFLFGLIFVDFKYKKIEEKGNLMDVLNLFCNFRYGTFIVISWFMGFTHGGIMNFLNWFLEDLGASKLMMGIATAFRCLAIIGGFFTSSFFIDVFGHMLIIFIALASYVASFFAYSFIPNPWWAIPVEIVQGLCYSMSWSACITYLGAAAPPNTAATMQGVLQGVYWGLGTGLGAIVGGIVINKYGVIFSFRAGGFFSLAVVIVFVVLQILIEVTDKRRKGSSGMDSTATKGLERERGED